MDELFIKKIVWGIDHHKSSNILSNVIIRPYCSCSLLIYDSFKKYYDFSNEEKFMIYMASLADSLFFKGSRFSEEDKNLIEELGYDMDSKAMFKKYFIPTDLSGGMEKVFSNISKKYNYRGAIFMDYRNNPIKLDSNTIIGAYRGISTSVTPPTDSSGDAIISSDLENIIINNFTFTINFM